MINRKICRYKFDIYLDVSLDGELQSILEDIASAGLQNKEYLRRLLFQGYSILKLFGGNGSSFDGYIPKPPTSHNAKVTNLSVRIVLVDEGGVGDSIDYKIIQIIESLKDRTLRKSYIRKCVITGFLLDRVGQNKKNGLDDYLTSFRYPDFGSNQGEIVNQVVAKKINAKKVLGNLM